MFFLISQVIGLFIISKYINVEEVTKIDLGTNETYIVNETVALELPYSMERPQFRNSAEFITYLIIAIILTTILLNKLKQLFWEILFSIIQ